MTSPLNRIKFTWSSDTKLQWRIFLTEAAANRTSHRLVRRFVTQNQVRPTHSLSSEQQQHQQQHNRQTAWLGASHSATKHPPSSTTHPPIWLQKTALHRLLLWLISPIIFFQVFKFDLIQSASCVACSNRGSVLAVATLMLVVGPIVVASVLLCY